MENDKPLRRTEAAQFLTDNGYKTAKRTLDVLATRGGGPKFSYWGRIPLYAVADLWQWVESRRSGPRGSTSEAS